ncbi:DUF262 domain-containing protein [Pedobacter antarcticus]|uniref:DUF262 domain-containing protein n=1 Tax=Pedobacter antarcticus TaxID=34086 RepID=UPI00292F3CA3|nr:DUF262 domain-containing protein [Pedobacter antarcticus]
MPDFKEFNSNLLPYNPNDVDIRRQTFSIEMVVEMMKLEEIELWRPNDFQRLSGLWTLKEKSRLIESLLMNIPLPIFYMDGSRRPWKIIDGLQRLTVLNEFINKNSFSLSDLQYQKDIEGCHFEDLSFALQRTIRNFFIEAYVINPGTPDDVKFNIFQRINTSGLRLNAQELRNAYYSGISADFIVSLVELPAFQSTIGMDISPKRMKDREFVLRFFAFYIGLESYSAPMDRFLDECMEQIECYDKEERQDIYGRFNRSLETCFRLFEDNAFFILSKNGSRLTNRPNIALFEAWTANLAQRDTFVHANLIRNRESLILKYLEYFHIPEFYRAITSTTTSKSSVDLRFAMISDLIDIST